MDLDDGQLTDDPEQDDTWGHPGTLAVTALVLAVLSLWGSQVFRGSLYTVTFAPGDNGLGQIGENQDYIIAGAFLTAAFALLPITIAKAGLRRLVPSDGGWVGHLLRAAFLLGTISLVLHATQALLALTVSDPVIRQFLY